MNAGDHAEFLLVAMLWAAVFVLPTLTLMAVVGCFITRPYRTLEPVQFLLEVLETGLKDGRRPEQAILECARQRGPSLNRQFRALTAALEQGLPLVQALERVPRLVPAQIAAMIRVGVEIGDLAKVLPAALRVLRNHVSRASLYFDLATATVTSLALMFILQVLGTWVFPKVQVSLARLDAGVGVLTPLLIDTLAGHLWLWTLVQAVFLVAMLVWGLIYLAGTERVVWLQLKHPQLASRIGPGLPWRHQRLQRDFSFLLAVLLDAQVPEEKAVALAAAGTGSPAFNQRAAHVIEDLRGGLWLPSALRHIDDQAELQWRLLKPIQNRQGFLRALAGWHDRLETRASQQEEIALQMTGLAAHCYNGVMVGLVAVAVFQFLITIPKLTAAW